jgi:hypothetical protein
VFSTELVACVPSFVAGYVPSSVPEMPELGQEDSYSKVTSGSHSGHPLSAMCTRRYGAVYKRHFCTPDNTERCVQKCNWC